VSVHFSNGVDIVGSVTTAKCTIAGRKIHVVNSSRLAGGLVSLVMEDCRVFCSDGDGVYCEAVGVAASSELEVGESESKLEMLRCIIEGNRGNGVDNQGGQVKLVDCAVRNNKRHGLYAWSGETSALGARSPVTQSMA